MSNCQILFNLTLGIVLFRSFTDLSRLSSICRHIPGQQSIRPDSAHCVILEAFCPLVLIVTYEVGVHHHPFWMSGTLGDIIFIQSLRSTVSYDLSQSIRLPRCCLKEIFTDFTRFSFIYSYMMQHNI